MMTIEEIKAAVDAGKKVMCDGTAYEVIKSGDEYYILHAANSFCTGLTGKAGTPYENVLNGTTFYIKGE